MSWYAYTYTCTRRHMYIVQLQEHAKSLLNAHTCINDLSQLTCCIHVKITLKYVYLNAL